MKSRNRIAAPPATKIKLKRRFHAQLSALALAAGEPLERFASTLAARLLRDEIATGISRHGTPWNFPLAKHD